ncbi:dipeptidase [Clostridium sediminicola]|uniref:dipeptidase n=1 Tax=Clostridium sediminicola TaxID=3114879 RepID=UPI0031F24097
MDKNTDFLIIDGHHQLWDKYLQDKMAGGMKSFDKTYYPKLKKAGVRAINLVITRSHTVMCIDSYSELYFWNANKILDCLINDLEQGCQTFKIIMHKEDLDDCIKEDKIAVMCTIENGRALEGKENLNLLSSLRNLYRLGLRSVQLTGNGRNRIADGCAEERTEAGITFFGVDLVKEMERLGVIIDTSALSDYGFYHLMELTSKPVIDSHTGCKSLNQFTRCISDERIKAIAERKGVIGISFLGELLNKDAVTAGMDDLIKNIEHVIEIAGIDCVALGPDFCEFDRINPLSKLRHPGWIEGISYKCRENDYIEGITGIEEIHKIADKLIKKGYSESDIRKIMGENWIRVWKEILPSRESKN